MTKLSDVIGAFMADLTHARLVADMATVEIARQYRQEELLHGLSIPRIRLPEVVIDLPVVIQEHVLGEDEEPAESSDVAAGAGGRLADLVVEKRLKLPPGFIAGYQASLAKELDRVLPMRAQEPGSSVRRLFSEASARVLRQQARETDLQLSDGDLEHLLAGVTSTVAVIAAKKPTRPPELHVLVNTEEVKSQANPETVTRLRLRMNEEGLEWNEIRTDGGNKLNRLAPE